MAEAAACNAAGIPEATDASEATSPAEVTGESDGTAEGGSGEQEKIVIESNKIERAKFEFPYTSRVLTAVNVHADSESDSEVLGILEENAEVTVERNIE